MHCLPPRDCMQSETQVHALLRPEDTSGPMQFWERLLRTLVSPASLLDSQHGCIASPHAKKESGQTLLAVWSCTVSKCGRIVSKDE